MRKGFTLIELLVVIAIISILAAILFPVFAQAKKAAHSSVCVSNAKQMGLVLQLYTDANDDRLPGRFWGGMQAGTRWPLYTVPVYAKTRSIAFCPLVHDHRDDTYGGGTMSDYIYGLTPNYGLNYWYLTQGNPVTSTTGVMSTSIAEVSRTVLLAESTWLNEVGSPDLGYWIVEPPSRWGGSPPLNYYSFGYVWPRHNNRANTVFADGHVKPMPVVGEGTLGDEKMWDIE